MPHAGQILPLAARRGIAALMGALMALGCAGSGELVVVIDTTMASDSVEVVALPASADDAASPARSPAAPADSVARLRALDDSASTLSKRFGELRDALADEVAAIDTMDRRTSAYARRYDAIMARTRDAERLRAVRDSVRDRASSLRERLGVRAEPVVAAASPGRSLDGRDQRPSQRRPVARTGSLTLSLAPGAWLIGLARPGFDPVRVVSVSVRAGAIDTVDLRGHRAPPRPGGR